MSADFYRAFEDRYRGARDEIGRRLAVYRPFLLALAAQAGRAGAGPARALDLGCGRGEWLELLAECGIAGRGVDLDEGMLRACRERHLDVEHADALASLRALPDASLALVSAFHLVEHLPFDLVQDIIAEAHRVLQPGGLLIFETPNPENLTVGASSFYLDPSHERPLPPALLAFAVEFGGFGRQCVLRLQEMPQLHGDGAVGLLTVLEGVSPDYAVVAQQGADAALTAPFDALFAADYGITLAALAQRYEAQLQRRDSDLHHALQDQAEQLHGLHTAHATVQDDLRGQHSFNHALEARLTDGLAALAERLRPLDGLPDRLAHVEARNAQLEQRIVDMLASTSWRVTAPLRWLSATAQRGAGALRQRRVGSGLRRRASGAVLGLMRLVLRRPRLKRAARAVVARLPLLQARLYRMLQHAPAEVPVDAPPASAEHLSPRALHAYQQLQRALRTRKH